MTPAEQVTAYLRLRRLLGWRELRGFESSGGGGFDGWMQHVGIAVWVNPQSGLNIGIKNKVGSGYGGLENYGSKGINHAPRSKMSYAEIAALWVEGFEKLPQFRKDAFVEQSTIALILDALGLIGRSSGVNQPVEEL